MAEFTMRTTVHEPFSVTLDWVRALLHEVGFGVLTEIDVSATLRAKLGVEVPPQVILGACRPELAHRALAADPRIAVMLPCNVVVSSETDQRTRVEVFDPAVMTSFSDAPELEAVASDARERLAGMLVALGGVAEGEFSAARA